MKQTETATNLFTSAIADQAENLEYTGRKIKALSYAQSLLVGIDLSDVSHVNASLYDYDRSYSIELTLKDECKSSRLIHKLARALSVKFVKSAGYGGTLMAKAHLEALNTSITVENYVPQTCKVVTTEEPMSEWEIADLKTKAEKLASGVLTKMVTKVVCK